MDFGCRSKSGADLGLCEDESYRGRFQHGLQYLYWFAVEHLRDSVFTLLLPEMEAFSQRFYEALLYGTIPVVVGSPYESKVLVGNNHNLAKLSCRLPNSFNGDGPR